MPILFIFKIFISKIRNCIMVYIKLFQTEQEKQACTDTYEYVSYTIESDKVNIHPYDYSKDYLTFIAKSSGTFAFSGSTTANTIYYSTDNGNTWSEPSRTVEITVDSGDKVLWKGNMTPFPNTSGPDLYWGIGRFSGSTAQFDAEGNPKSLLYGDNFVGQTLESKINAFSYLFASSNIVNANNLSMDTILTNYCYYGMFHSCISLSKVPSLLATTLTYNCYGRMFYGTNVLPDCSNIDFTSESVVQSGGLSELFAGTKVTDNDLMNILPINPQTNHYWLPATTLGNGCYQNMFDGCTSLTTAPELPATTLARLCYYLMFANCTNLTQAPELPATNLVYACYNGMFNGCTNLNYIKAMFTTTPTTNYTSNWVNGVATNGTFVKNSTATWDVSGVHGIPEGWTVQDA